MYFLLSLTSLLFWSAEVYKYKRHSITLQIIFKKISIEINFSLDDNEPSLYTHRHTHILFINGFKLHFYCTILSSQQVGIHNQAIHEWLGIMTIIILHSRIIITEIKHLISLLFIALTYLYTFFVDFLLYKLLLNKMNIKFKAFLSSTHTVMPFNRL